MANARNTPSENRHQESAFFDRTHKFSQDVLSRRMLGYSFLRAWVFLAFFNEMFYAQAPQGTETNTLIYQISLIALVFTLFICGLLNTRCEAMLQSKIALAAPALLCAIGTLAIPFASYSSNIGIAMFALSGIATGVGSALLTLLWGRIYSAEGGPTAAAEVSVSYLLAALLVPLFGMLDPITRSAITSILPLCSNALLVSGLRNIGPWDEEARAFANADACCSKVENERCDRQKHDGIRFARAPFKFDYANTLLKFSISSLVFGCVISIVRFISTFSAAPEYSATYSPFVPPLAALIVCSIMLGILFFSKNLDLAFSYKTVIILMMLGCLILPFSDKFGSLSHSLSYMLTLAGYICFEIMSWIILADMTFRFGVPPFRAFGFGRCAVSGGVLIGSLLSGAFTDALPFSLELSFAISCAMAFALVIAYTLTLTERDIARIHRTPTPIQSPDDANEASLSGATDDERADRQFETLPQSLDDRVMSIAQEHEISGRMLEVMQLLAQGRSAARIEQELYISRGTVNTYSYRLYQKLGIHSRQELLDMVYHEADGRKS